MLAQYPPDGGWSGWPVRNYTVNSDAWVAILGGVRFQISCVVQHVIARPPLRSACLIPGPIKGIFMKTYCKVFGACTALAALTACGGGGSGGGGSDALLVSGSDEDNLRIFADVTDDLISDQDIADVFVVGDIGEPSGGRILTARNVSTASWSELPRTEGDPDGGYTPYDGFLQIEAVDNGDDIDLIVRYRELGETELTEVIIPAANTIDSNIYEELDGDDRTTLFFGVFNEFGVDIAGLVDDDQPSGSSARIFFFTRENLASPTAEYNAVIGVETEDLAIDTLIETEVIASYDGFARLQTQAADADFGNFTANVLGSVSMTADFGQGTISGSITGLSGDYRDAGGTVLDDDPIDGTILMEEADIEFGGFAGSVSTDDMSTEFTGLLDGIGYSGTFYGGAAEEVGGVFEGTSDFDGETFHTIGNFQAIDD